MFIEERDHAVVKQVGRHQRGFTVIELGECQFGVGVEKRLLIDTTDALERADIERILRAAVARAFALELTVRLLVGLGFFQRGELALAQHPALLRALRLQGLEPLVHGLEIVTLPDAAHAGRRHAQPALLQLVGDAHLTPGGLADRDFHYRLLNLRRHPIPEHRLAPRDLLQRRLAAPVVKVLETVEAVAAVAHHPAGRRHVPELLGQLQYSHLYPDYFLLLIHRPRLLLLRTRGPYHHCQIKSWLLQLNSPNPSYSQRLLHLFQPK